MPWWAVVYLVPSFRPRSSWTYARALFVKAGNVAFVALFNAVSLDFIRRDRRPLAEDEGKVGLVWIDAAPELVVGDVKKYAELNQVSPARVVGYWYGKRDSETKLAGQSAELDEKVILNFHCQYMILYWFLNPPITSAVAL